METTNTETGCCDAVDDGKPCKCLPLTPARAVDAISCHAAQGLLSYRCKSRFGRILIGAKDDADAWREARRSTDEPRDMEVLVDGVWKEVK